jgi:hypothetical protein
MSTPFRVIRTNFLPDDCADDSRRSIFAQEFFQERRTGRPASDHVESQMRLAAKDIPFRILKGWRITVNRRSKYKAQTCIDAIERRATIYGWPKDSKEPPDFMFHELLHIAFRATKPPQLSNYEGDQRLDEELLIQDICKVKFP